MVSASSRPGGGGPIRLACSGSDIHAGRSAMPPAVCAQLSGSPCSSPWAALLGVPAADQQARAQRPQMGVAAEVQERFFVLILTQSRCQMVSALGLMVQIALVVSELQMLL